MIFWLLLPAALLAGPRGGVTPLTHAWESPIPTQRVPAGLVTMRAAECGACHTEIYAEWKRSTHAHAFSDRQFQAEWEKDGVFVCRNCHTPLQNQIPTVVTGLIGGDYRKPVESPNLAFDAALKQEGITCATCHVREGAVRGPTGGGQAAHASARDTSMGSGTLCLTCHNVSGRLNPTLVCSFETGDQWRRSWAPAAGRTCTTCHMPDTIRAVVAGGAPRRSRVHDFAGSGIPKERGDTVCIKNGLEIVADSVRGVYARHAVLHYTLTLRNRFAGHNVPTGDPERFLIVSFRLRDADGTVWQSKDVRIGQDWEWYPVARKLADNTLAPLEERAIRFSSRLPDVRGLALTVEVSKHRMSATNAAFNHLPDSYPLSIEIFARTFPVRLASQ